MLVSLYNGSAIGQAHMGEENIDENAQTYSISPDQARCNQDAVLISSLSPERIYSASNPIGRLTYLGLQLFPLDR